VGWAIPSLIGNTSLRNLSEGLLFGYCRSFDPTFHVDFFNYLFIILFTFGSYSLSVTQDYRQLPLMRILCQSITQE
jgi:hypothetical protein